MSLVTVSISWARLFYMLASLSGVLTQSGTLCYMTLLLHCDTFLVPEYLQHLFIPNTM